MTDAAATTGQLLKAERERRGLSSQKAADELHLDAWVVDALEAEDYERVGPSVYAKGHLKRYAALLGLSPSDILAGYELRSQASKIPPPQPANVRLRTDAPAVSNLPWRPILGLLAAAVLVLGVLWWKPWQQRGAESTAGRQLAETPSAASPDTATNSSGDRALVNSAVASPATQPSAEPSAAIASTMPVPTPTAASAASAVSAALMASSKVSTSSAAASVTPAPSPDADAAAGTGRARLRLSFSADSWVDVHDAEGKRAFAGNGRANSVRTIAGTAPMRVYLGFASGVQLEINNRAVAIGPQFMAGDVARFEAGADGVLRRDSHTVVPPTVQTRNARPTG
jgi:cytoskeleton protein RodZ